MKNKKNKNQTPLTLEGLVSYNQEILFPFLRENFVSNKKFDKFENEINEFRNETLTNFDAMGKKLDILLTEKEVRQYQDEKQKKLWLVVIKALKKHNILSSEELEKISRLEIF